MRGKEQPKDIDILIIFRGKVDKDVEYEFKRQCSAIQNIAITSRRSSNICEGAFTAREGVLFEGYDLIRRKFLAAEAGYSSLGLFIYRTHKLNNATKTRFYYALNGRLGAKGVADSLKAIKMSDNILAVPLEKIELAKEFFKCWDIDYVFVPTLIPSRLAKAHIIGKL